MTPWLLLGCALAPLGCGQTPGDPQKEEAQSISPYDLTAAEIRQARQLAETNPAFSEGKTVFVKMELLPTAQAETVERQVKLTHYRYENDETVYTFVNLRTNEVMPNGYAVLHAPTALAEEEMVLAEKVVRADPRLAGLFAAHGKRLKIEMRPTHLNSDAGTLAGRRLAMVDFVVGEGYVNPRAVIVDLAAEQVYFGLTSVSTAP